MEKGGGFEIKRGEIFDSYQRAFGRDRANRAFTPMIGSTQMSMEELAAGSRELAAQGKLPSERDKEYLLSRGGLGLSDAMMAQGARTRTGGTKEFYRTAKDIIGEAGLGNVEAYSARGAFTDAAANAAAPYMFNTPQDMQASLAMMTSMVGQFQAAAARGTKISPIESVNAGVSMAKIAEEALKNPMNIEGMQTDLWLSSIGVTDPRTQQLVKSKGLQNMEAMRTALVYSRASKLRPGERDVNREDVSDADVIAAQNQLGRFMAPAIKLHEDYITPAGRVDARTRAESQTFSLTGDIAASEAARLAGISPLDAFRSFSPAQRQERQDKEFMSILSLNGFG
jgi:hypothetical protein